MNLETELEDVELAILSAIWTVEDACHEVLKELRRIEAKLDQILTERKEIYSETKPMF